MKRPTTKKRQRRVAPVANQTEIVTKEVAFDDRKAGGAWGRFTRMTANVEGREITAELYDPFAGDEGRHFLSLSVHPYSQGEEADVMLYLTPAQINALAGIFASARDKARPVA